MITVSVSYVHESLQSFRQFLQSITTKNLQLKLHFTSSSESLPVITVWVCVCMCSSLVPWFCKFGSGPCKDSPDECEQLSHDYWERKEEKTTSEFIFFSLFV